MHKSRIESIQKAQGMVEFALVLPILLLIILGIFAFGHLFFVYSSTVSASREAARFGSAVGVTSGGLPRYKDCDSIRGVAVQRGLFAGVTNDASVVDIEYDRGPGTSTFGSCPVGGTGPEVELGDRIIVSINIQYQSIVPIVNLPSFPLSAVTRRTIVRSLPLSEAPTAEPICPLTQISMTLNGEQSTSDPDAATVSVVGQPVDIVVSVTADDGSLPDNNNSIQLLDGDDNILCADLDADTDSCSLVYWEAGDYAITAVYEGDLCYEPSILAHQVHKVLPADTVTTITAVEGDPILNRPVNVRVQVQALSPGARQTWAGETVEITTSGLIPNGVNSCTAALDAAGIGSCPINLERIGPVTITAAYAGDENYNPSSGSWDLVVKPPPTPSPTPVINVTPTKTPLPSWCPRVSGGIIFTTDDDIFHFDVRNPGTSAADVTSVKVTWPDGSPIARLSDVRFDLSSNHLERSCTHTNGPDCLWYSTTGLNPPTQLINNSLPNWTNLGLAANQTKQMRMVFSHTLQNGPYRVEIRFSNNCVLELEANRLIND